MEIKRKKVSDDPISVQIVKNELIYLIKELGKNNTIRYNEGNHIFINIQDMVNELMELKKSHKELLESFSILEKEIKILQGA